MKVAVVTKYFPTATHPWAGHSAFQTLRVLASCCDLHVFRPVPDYPSFLKPEDPFGLPGDGNWSQSEVEVTYIPYPVLPVVSRPLNGFIMANRVLPHVRKFQPDVILDYIVYPDGYAAVRIGRALKVPVVLTAIGSDLNRMADPLCAHLTRSALHDADVVTTVSHDLAKTAIRLGADPAKTVAILNGCDTSVFHPQDRAFARQTLSLDADTEIVLYVGRLDTRKGVIELIDAVAALHASRPMLRCYIVGDGPDRSLVHEAIARNGAAEWIKVMPTCSTAEISMWMAASNLATLPSYNEGCPNVVVEALAAGRPMVATNVGGIPELMDDTCGRLIAVKDVAALKQALDEVLERPWNAEAIASKHGRSWANVADDLYDVLAHALHPL